MISPVIASRKSLVSEKLEYPWFFILVHVPVVVRIFVLRVIGAPSAPNTQYCCVSNLSVTNEGRVAGADVRVISGESDLKIGVTGVVQITYTLKLM